MKEISENEMRSFLRCRNPSQRIKGYNAMPLDLLTIEFGMQIMIEIELECKYGNKIDCDECKIIYEKANEMRRKFWANFKEEG